MRNIICTLLFNLIIFLNYAELWAMDGRKNFALPPPRPNRFGPYPPGAVFWNGQKRAGFLDKRFKNFVRDRDGFPFEPLMETKAYLPQAAFVWRDLKQIGILKNEEILTQYTNGAEGILTPQNGDEVKVKVGNEKITVARYHDGWAPVPRHPAGR